MKWQFAVVNDTHYVRQESQPDTEHMDVSRYIYMNKFVLPRMFDEIREAKPELIIHTGDVIQGTTDAEDHIEEMKDGINTFRSLDIPIFFAVGNHDGHPSNTGREAVSQVMGSANCEALGSNLQQTFYAFERNGCLFIILDFVSFRTGDAQDAFLEDQLSKGKDYDHVFMFAHPPLVPLGRPFFSKYDFANRVARLVSKYGVDAYFCGHTHNHIASLHRFGDHWIPQLKSTAIGYPDKLPLPLEEVRPILSAEYEQEWGWGFLEDTASGWWLVTVEENNVQIDWHMTGRGKAGEILCSKSEKPVIRLLGDWNKETTRNGFPEAEQIQSVRLKMTGRNVPGDSAFPVKINDCYIGDLPPLASFSYRFEIPIQPELWPVLRSANEVRIELPELASQAVPFCMGAFQLELETLSGVVRSSVSDYYYTNSEEWDEWKMSSAHRVDGQEVQVVCSFRE